MSDSYREARQAWLDLEQLKCAVPTDDGRCRKCGAATTDAICATCEERRLEGLRRFGGRGGAPRYRRRVFTSADAGYRFPYKEPED